LEPLPTPAVVVARLITAGLAAAMAAIHLHLWSIGYRHLHIIGILFLLNGIGGIALALALLLVPRVLLGAVAAVTTLFTAGTLAGLVVSLTAGLFGFKDYIGAPYLKETIVIESVGIVVTGALAILYARPTLAWWHEHRPGHLRASSAPH
jgi:hypothetical protein